MSEKTQTMSTPLTIAHVVILLANFTIVASGIYVNLMMPEHPAINLEIALGLGFFLGAAVPLLIVVRSFKGTLKDITFIMAVGPILAAFDVLLFLRGVTGAYLSTLLSMIMGFSAACLVTELQVLWKISRMSFHPNVPKSAAIAMAFIILLVTPGLAPVFALSDLRRHFPSF